jgi:hypothetical protein
MQRFDAPWDGTLKLSTGLFLVLMLGMALGLAAFDIRLGPEPEAFRWGLLIGPAIVAIVIPGAWVLAPRGYTIGGGELTVNRPIFPVRIPLATIRGVTLVDRKQAGAFVKVAGAAGLFGHYGRFYSSALGAFRLYATRRDQLVVVDTDAGRFVLTPATPERFVEALGLRAPGAALSLAGAGSTGSPGGPWKLVLAIAFAVPLLVGAILGVAWGRAPCAAAVEADAVRIDHRWGEPERIPLAGIRGVEPLTPDQARGWWRVNGVGGLGGSSYGRFRSDRLGPFTLHAWRSGPYVLLETAGGKVVLTPDDPGAFVTELRARLGR